MSDQQRGSAKREGTLVRSKSLRLPTTKSRAAEQASSGTGSLTRHGSMRLHKGGSSVAGTNVMSSSYHGQLPTSSSSTTAPPAGNTSPKKSQALSVFKKPFLKLKGGNKGGSDGDKCSRKGKSAVEEPKKTLKQSSRDSSDHESPKHSVTYSESVQSCSESPGSIRSDRSKSPHVSIVDSRGPEIDYCTHLKRLTEEHEKLQMEYARLRMQLLEKEALFAQSKHPAWRDLATIPEDEIDVQTNQPSCSQSSSSSQSVMLQGYRQEVQRLQDELRRIQKKYWEQVMNSENSEKEDAGAHVVQLLKQLEEKDKDLNSSSSRCRRLEEELSQSIREVATCRDALQDYQMELEELRKHESQLRNQNRDYESELAETKESAEFLQAEISTMSEALQEMEQSRAVLQAEVLKHRENNKLLLERCQKLYNKVQEKSIKVHQLQAELEMHSQAQDMLLSQGAELSTAALSLSQLSLKLHSYLKSSAVFAATHLQLDNEVLDEVMSDVEIGEDDGLSSSSKSSSGILSLKDIPNGHILSNSLSSKSDLKESKPKGDSASNSSMSVPSSAASSPAIEGSSLVQTIIQALDQSKKLEPSGTEHMNGSLNGSSELPHEEAKTSGVKMNGYVSKDDDSKLNTDGEVPVCDKVGDAGKPVGTVTPFRTVTPDVINNKGIKEGTREGCLDGLIGELSTLLGKLVRIQTLIHTRVQEKFRNSEEQIDELKKNLDTVCKKNIESEQESSGKNVALEQASLKLSDCQDKFIQVQESHKREVESLCQVIEELKEKNRCLLAVNQEQARQIKEEVSNIKNADGEISKVGYITDAIAICDKLILKQEIASLKEGSIAKDELLKSMAAKFSRSQKVWEENYQRAHSDIQKLDDMIDKIVETLKGVPEVVENCQPLKELLDNLSGTPPPNRHSLSSPRKSLESVTCHVVTTL